MRRIKVISVLWTFCLLMSNANAQEVMQLSLQSAVEYATKNNPGLINAHTDVEIAKKKVKETTSIGLPQVNASLSYSNYPNIPTQLLPDFLSPVVYGVLYEEGLVNEIPGGVSDRLFEAQFGTKHNMTAQASVSQLLFNGPYIVGLQAARAYVEFSSVQEKKTRTQVEEAVKNAYYQVLISEQSVVLLDSTKASLQGMLEETKAIYKQGFLEETDVDQLELLLSDLESSLSNTRNQRTLAYRFLKYQMGMPLEQDIQLTETLESHLAKLNQEVILNKQFDPENHIDFAIVRNQETLNRLDLKRYKSLYLPSLSAFYNYQQVAQRQEFDFTQSGGDWYPTEVVGVQLDIPLWSSGSRKYQVQQAKLALDKTEVLSEQIKQGLTLEAANARNSFENAWLIFRNKENSMKVAEKIYQRMRIRYKEGMSSSLDLQQAYNQYLQSEGDYIGAMLQLFSAKTTLEKIYQEL